MNLTRTLTSTLAGAALAVSGVALTAAPSQAIGSDKVCADRAYNNGLVKTCLQANFEPQADGTGVILKGYGITTPRNCDRLEEPYPYEDIATGWVVPSNGNIKASSSGGSQYDCNRYTATTQRGAEKGPMLIRWSADVRINNGPDRRFGMAIYLYANGQSKKAWAYDQDDVSR